MKALADLNIDLDSKAVAELLVSKLLPGALVGHLGIPGVKHRVIGYNKEDDGVIITTTVEAYMPGWCSFTPRDMVVIQGYEEVRKVYEYLDMIAVSDDLADYIEEQVAAMEKETQY